jgi:hypothetical protein
MHRTIGAVSAIALMAVATAIWSQAGFVRNAAGFAAAPVALPAEPTAAAKIAERFPTATERFLPFELVRQPVQQQRETVGAAPAKAEPQPAPMVERRVVANIPNASRAPAASCKQDLVTVAARLDRALAHVKRGDARASTETCAAYRQSFFDVVKAREVTALCKTGTERAQDLGRIDAAVEDINGAIATSCGT